MSRPLAVLRPEPGNAATRARAEAAGFAAVALPLFAVRALDWEMPDPARFDALVLTSANAPRHAGPALAALAALPVYAVGVATADAAREAGLHVRMTGTADAAALLADARAKGVTRALHLAGRERIAPAPPIVASLAVYASEPRDFGGDGVRALAGSVALLHSPRAARRLAELVDRAGLARDEIRLAAFSLAVSEAAGPGWAAVAVAERPDDAALLAAAATLAIDRAARDADNAAMSDALSRDPAPRRRLPLMLVLLLLAFAAGLMLMAWLMTHVGWFSRQPAPAPSPVARVIAAPSVAPAAAPAMAAVNPSLLDMRESQLAGQLTNLEGRAAALTADANAAAGQAGRAEAMLLAFAVRRTIDRGLRLGALELPLRARFGAVQPRETQAIVQASQSPLTLEDLRNGLDLISTDLVSGGGNWWSSMRNELGSLVVIHRAGTPSPAPADRLARIRRLVETGQVEAALAEVVRMPGAAGAARWQAAARRWIELHRSLDALETTAIEGRALPTVAPVSVPAPPAR